MPLKFEGNIVVDNILASCYAEFDHHLAHIVMTPMRWFPDILEWIFWDDKGFKIFAKIAEDLGKYVQV